METALAHDRSVPPGGAAGTRPAPRASPLSIDSRTVLAASGFVMVGFVAAHLAGNLLAFAGSAAFNAYARALRELGAPVVGEGGLLTVARVALAGTLLAHLGAHLRLLLWGDTTTYPTAGRTWDADGGRHGTGFVPAAPSYAAFPRPVFLTTGGVLALFLVFHLAQLTFGAANPAFDPADTYGNTVAALRSWPVALAYIGAAAAVGAHLLPGIWTGMRSLHLIRPHTARLSRVLAPAIALVTALGLAAVPAAVLVGILS